MKYLFIPYLFVIIQYLCVKFYVEILNKKYKVPCKYGMQVSWILPFVILVILLFLLNKKKEIETDLDDIESGNFLDTILNIILIIGLCPLLVVSLLIAISSSGVKNTFGSMESYCIQKKIYQE